MPRADVIAALEALSDVDLHARWADGTSTWPDLDAVVHWLIDDTWLGVGSIEERDRPCDCS